MIVALKIVVMNENWDRIVIQSQLCANVPSGAIGQRVGGHAKGSDPDQL